MVLTMVTRLLLSSTCWNNGLFRSSMTRLPSCAAITRVSENSHAKNPLASIEPMAPLRWSQTDGPMSGSIVVAGLGIAQVG